jgi:hypothetical protein
VFGFVFVLIANSRAYGKLRIEATFELPQKVSSLSCFSAKYLKIQTDVPNFG